MCVCAYTFIHMYIHTCTSVYTHIYVHVPYWSSSAGMVCVFVNRAAWNKLSTGLRFPSRVQVPKYEVSTQHHTYDIEDANSMYSIFGYPGCTRRIRGLKPQVHKRSLQQKEASRGQA